MTSIIFWIETIWRNQFGRNYLKNKKLFLDFFFIFEIYIKFWTFWNKNVPDSWFFSENTHSEKRS